MRRYEISDYSSVMKQLSFEDPRYGILVNSLVS